MYFNQNNYKNMNSKTTNILLWIVQILLGIMFTMVGIMKTFQPIEEMAKNLPWVTDYALLVRFIGVSELAAGLGLILPSALRILPKLTVWAAIGLAVIMFLAIIFHIIRGEMDALPVNTILLLLFVFVAWGRSKKAIIESKN